MSNNSLKLHIKYLQEIRTDFKLINSLGIDIIPNEEGYVIFSSEEINVLKLLADIDFLEVKTTLRFNTFIKGFTLPNNLKALNGLSLSKSGLSVLPENLFVDGNLILTETKIKELPSNLIVTGTISIRELQIKHIPRKLRHKIRYHR